MLRGKELSETSCLKSYKLENGYIKELTLYVQMSVFLCLYVFLVFFSLTLFILALSYFFIFILSYFIIFFY